MEKKTEKIKELVEARLRSGMTITEISNRIQVKGNAVQKWERGYTSPTDAMRFLYLYWLRQQGDLVSFMEDLPEDVRKKIPEKHKTYVVPEQNEYGEIFVTAQAKRLVNGTIQNALEKKRELEKRPRLKQSMWIVYTENPEDLVPQ